MSIKEPDDELIELVDNIAPNPVVGTALTFVGGTLLGGAAAIAAAASAPAVAGAGVGLGLVCAARYVWEKINNE